MPVYDQSYRTYHGTLRRRGRWAVTVSQEMRVLFARRMFIFLVLLGNFHLLLRVLWIYVLDVVSKQPMNPFYGNFAQFQFENVGAWVYFDFLRLQSPLIFLTLIYAGSGLICNDFRNNLVEIYFSKPINWRDYVLGKVMSLLTIGLGLTALPALIMAGVHVLFDPTMHALKDSLSNVFPIIGFSLLLVGSFSLVILASSALTDSGKFAGVAVFLLTFVNIIAAGLVAGLLEKQDYLFLVFPVTLNNVGVEWFNDTRFPNPIHVDWKWSLAYALGVCLIALFIVARKARRAETGR